ncbi:MAG: hypothetical protein ACREES_08855, partial [Stellaceae bacterium]
MGATTNSVGAATNTIGAAATGTLNATSGAVAGAGTAATGTAVDPTIRADDTGSLAALQASGFVKSGSDPVRLVARSVNSMGEP